MSEQTTTAAEQASVPLFEETFTGAAIDGARIAATAARILVELDHTVPEENAMAVLQCLTQAEAWLHRARGAFPQSAPATSVHVVRGGGIILPP